MENLKEAIKNLIKRYELQIDIELKAEVRATKAEDDLAQAMAKGGLEALRALRAHIQSVSYALYPTPEERLNFILAPLTEVDDIRTIRAQIRTLKSNDQYRAIGRIAQRALEFFEENNNDTDNTGQG